MAEIDLERAGRRITAALFVAQAMFSAALIAAFTLSPILAAEMGGSETATGLPTFLNLISRAILAYPLGWLLDRFGRRVGLSLGYLTGVAGAVLTVWSVLEGSFAGFLAGAFLFGGSRAAAEQGRYVAAEVMPAGRRARVIGIVVAAGTLGAVFGPLAVGPSSRWAEGAGLVADAGPFVASAVGLILALLITFLFLRPDPRELGQRLALLEQARDGEGASLRPARPMRQIFRHPMVILA
ncbi:MAG: MFS transporter, partial [Candidatus Promineifilaceae bacterium]